MFTPGEYNDEPILTSLALPERISVLSLAADETFLFPLILQVLNVVVISEIWNHYSSGIYRSRIPYLEVNVPRTKRLAGQPKMNLVSLVTHGLSSIAVYGDVVGTKLLLSIIILLIICLLILCSVVLIRVSTDWAIPGWATYVCSFLILFLVQLILTGAIFSMIILSSRNQSNFISVRDYKYYVDAFFKLKP